MKSKLIAVIGISMFIISCSTVYNDPYGRNYIPSESNIKNINVEKIEKEAYNNSIIEKVENENNEMEEFLSTLTNEERQEYDRLYNPDNKLALEKPLEKDPNNYKNIQIKSGEERIAKEEKKVSNLENPVIINEKNLDTEKTKTEEKNIVLEKTEVEKNKEQVVEVEKEKILPKYTKEDYESIKLTSSDVKILNLIKKHYETLESYDILELKTKELIYIIRKEQDPNISSTKVLQEIHEMIKELKTRSFIIAINRVAKNRRLR